MTRYSVLHDFETLTRLSEREQRRKTDPNDRGLDSERGARLVAIRRVGDDGVSVELGASWSEEHMRREPEDRAR